MYWMYISWPHVCTFRRLVILPICHLSFVLFSVLIVWRHLSKTTDPKKIVMSSKLQENLIVGSNSSGWCHSAPPTHNKWIQEVLRCITLENIRFSLKGLLNTSYGCPSSFTSSLWVLLQKVTEHLPPPFLFFLPVSVIIIISTLFIYDSVYLTRTFSLHLRVGQVIICHRTIVCYDCWSTHLGSIKYLFNLI